MGSSVVDDLALPLGGLATIGVAGLLVGVRGEIDPAITALVLAVVVALSGRFGGRAAGVTAAVVAAASFDFMHTKPYLSLKISDATDILITVLLLIVGLIVGGLAARAGRDRRRAYAALNDPNGLERVLHIARTSSADDVQMAVRAELLGMMNLQDCWFTTDAVLLPKLTDRGALEASELRYTHDGFELPRTGIAIEVAAYGQRCGYLVCQPTPGAGVSLEKRRVAVELANVLGLALRSKSAAA